MADLSIETIGERVSTWGEGPVYWEDHLLYVDIEDHKLVRLDPETGEEAISKAEWSGATPKLERASARALNHQKASDRQAPDCPGPLEDFAGRRR